ncbi:MAG: hypothetical protein JNK60_01575 [Acidobacteria bacterium]|nr:hypothetical protein [Acidobacteriota bacterium]
MIVLSALAALVLFAPGDPHGAKPGSVTLPPLSAERPASGPTTLNVGCIVLPAGSQVKDGSVPDMGFGEILLPSGQSLRWTNGKVTPQPKKGDKGVSSIDVGGDPLSFRPSPGAGPRVLQMSFRGASFSASVSEKQATPTPELLEVMRTYTAAACGKAK